MQLELPHDKTKTCHVRSAKSQISLGVRQAREEGVISDINLIQVCRWASTDPPYKCILEYGKGIPINVYTIIEDNKK